MLLTKLSLGLGNIHVLESEMYKLVTHGCGILSSNAGHRGLLNSVNSQTGMKFFYPDEVPWKCIYLPVFRRDRVAFVLSYNTPVAPSLHGFDHPFLFKSVSL